VAFLVLTFLICLTLPLLQINLIPTVKAVADWTTPVAIHSKCGETSPNLAVNSIDDNTTTRWNHNINCEHWIIFDMGETKKITKIRLYSSGVYDERFGGLSGFKVYVGDDPANLGDPVWEGTVDWGAGWQESGSFDKNGRYIKLLTNYGLYKESIYEFDAYVGLPTVTVTIVKPANTTYLSSTIPVQLSASGGTIDKIWYNCKNGTEWIYGSNITYMAPTSMTGFINGSSYMFYAWANNTDGNWDEETVMFTVAIPPSPPPSHNSFNLYFPLNTKLAFQHLDIPYVTSGATITLTVTSGTLNGTSGTFAMYPTSGRLTFTAQEAGAITLTSTSNATNFRINGEVASSASIVDGLNYVIEWSFLEPILLLPIMFILGMFGLGSMFAGPIYGIYKVKHDEYYEGFRTGLIVTVLGVALTIAWLWSGA